MSRFDSKLLHTFIDEAVSKGSGVLEAIVDFSERNNVELQTIADSLKRSQKYKAMLATDASRLKMLKNE